MENCRAEPLCSIGRSRFVKDDVMAVENFAGGREIDVPSSGRVLVYTHINASDGSLR